jgi:hypothetical protein
MMLTENPYHKGDKVPCSHLEHEEGVTKRYQHEERDKDDVGCHARRIIVIFLGVASIVVGHGFEMVDEEMICGPLMICMYLYVC